MSMPYYITVFESFRAVQTETIIWGTVTTAVVCCRYVSQYILKRSVTMFNWDDYLMVFNYCVYVVTLFAINEFAGLNEAYKDVDNPEPGIQRISGIWSILSETAYVTTLWGVKAGLLGIYARLSSFQIQKIAVKVMAVFVGLSYLAVIFTLYFGFCHPFDQYLTWDPTEDQCWTFQYYYYVQMSMNIPSDLIILCIPISLVIQTRIHLRKKLLLCCVFGLGIFVVISAILTKYYTLKDPLSQVWELWYIRETSTAMIVPNALLCPPLCRKIASFKNSFPGHRHSHCPKNETSTFRASKVVITKPASYRANSDHDPELLADPQMHGTDREWPGTA